ncbi:MAG: GatB/YqeY domain-containing protein [Gemmatimonadota bacterium]
MSEALKLRAKLQEDLNASRKARTPEATLCLGTTLSDLKNREIELDRDLTDDDVVEVLRKGIKKRKESVEAYEKANRPELVKKERDEVTQLEAYLPPQASTDDIRVAVKAAIAGGANNVGAVMGKVMPQFKGKAEGGVISAIVREELAGK